MTDDLPKLAEDTLMWKRTYDRETIDLYAEIAEAVRLGDSERTSQLEEERLELEQPRLYLHLRTVLSGGLIDHMGMAEALRVFPSFYTCLCLEPGRTLIQRKLQSLIYTFWDGRNDPVLGEVCAELLSAVLNVLLEPPRLRQALDKANQPKASQSIPPGPHLQVYEWLLKRAQNVCRDQKGLARVEAVLREFPEVKKRREDGSFVDNLRKDIEPQWVAYNILAEWLNSNPNDVKKEIGRARKVRKAILAATGVDYAYEMDFSPIRSQLKDLLTRPKSS